jgi:hypothetical protein
MSNLPKHGKIECRKCFVTGDIVFEPHPKWRLRNDPGAWGCSRPKVLVLGFSKGETQSDIYRNGSFDDVAFGGEITRRYLTKILKKVNLLRLHETVDEKIAANEDYFAFGSLVRCSAARIDDDELKKSGKKKYLTSGKLILKSFSEIPEIINNCTEKYLANLPSSVELVCFLGVTDQYIKKCKNIVKKLYPAGFEDIDTISYNTNQFLCVHLTHPSKGNGTKDAWLDTDLLDDTATSRNKASAKKRDIAIKAIGKTGATRS